MPYIIYPDQTGCGRRPLATDNGRSEITLNGRGKRIVGGRVAENNTWPSICRLRRNFNGGYGQCGGTLVKNNRGEFYFISAAHCMKDRSIPASKFVAYCGIHHLDDIDTDKGLHFEAVTPHWDYNFDDEDDVDNDIAIFKFLIQPTESNFIRAACIAKDDHQPGEASIAVGWGLDSAGGNRHIVVSVGYFSSHMLCFHLFV